MQIPKIIEVSPIPGGDIDNDAAAARGFAMAAECLNDPTGGLALLHAAALLMAYLASQEEAPLAAARALIDEQNANLITCLSRMTTVPAGNA